MKIFDDTFVTLERALDVRAARHQKLSHNIANLDTPGFRPIDVDFAESLRAAEAHGDNSEPAPLTLMRGTESAPTPDGNTVDLDATMTALAENGAQYTAATRMAQKRLALLRYVASDGMG